MTGSPPVSETPTAPANIVFGNYLAALAEYLDATVEATEMPDWVGDEVEAAAEHLREAADRLHGAERSPSAERPE